MVMTKNIELRKKICLLGDPAVGKTSLIRKYAYNQFSNQYLSTIGTDITKKDITVDFGDNSNEIKTYNIDFAIWDMMGQKEYRILISKFFKNASGALLICDLTRLETLENLKNWTSLVFGAIGKIPIIFVGNKFDLVNKSEFNSDDLLEFSSRFGSPWITTSAKYGENVDQAFRLLGKLIIRNTLYFKRMNSLIDVLDAIIVDFCEVNGGLEKGMPLFKHQFKKIPKANLKEPKMELLQELIDGLINITREKKGKDIASFQNNRFNSWLKKIN
jgi:small GTP-binding protein